MIAFTLLDPQSCMVEIKKGFFNHYPNSIPFSYGCVIISPLTEDAISITRNIDESYGLVTINGNIILEFGNPIETEVILPYTITIYQEILDV